jgi:hypothetical protein
MAHRGHLGQASHCALKIVAYSVRGVDIVGDDKMPDFGQLFECGLEENQSPHPAFLRRLALSRRNSANA